MQILLVEGDAHYAHWLAEKLSAAGFRTHAVLPEARAFASGEARVALATIIDADGEGMQAWKAVRCARNAGHDAPVLVISGRENWREKVECLDAGADDFLVKPIRSEEISARLRAMIRRSAGRSGDRLVRGPLAVDLKTHCAWLGGDLLDLTRNEFRLVSRMLMWPDRIHTTGDILELIQSHGGSGLCSANAVEVLVTRVRRKVGRDTIRTVRGLGYRLAPETELVGHELGQLPPTRRRA